MNSRARKKLRRRERFLAMRGEVLGMDEEMRTAVYADAPSRTHEPWAGQKSPPPIGAPWLTTSFHETREKLSGEAYIYGIADPEDHVIRYVGKTAVDLDQRLWEHEFSPSNKALCSFLKTLRRDGRKAEIVTLEICQRYRWWFAEERWISALMPYGKLFNISLGGRWDNPKHRKGKAWTKAKRRSKARIDAAAVASQLHGQVKFYSRDEIAALEASRHDLPCMTSRAPSP